MAADRPDARFEVPSVSIERMLLIVGLPLLALVALVVLRLAVTPAGRHRRR